MGDQHANYSVEKFRQDMRNNRELLSQGALAQLLTCPETDQESRMAGAAELALHIGGLGERQNRIPTGSYVAPKSDEEDVSSDEADSNDEEDKYDPHDDLDGYSSDASDISHIPSSDDEGKEEVDEDTDDEEDHCVFCLAGHTSHQNPLFRCDTTMEGQRCCNGGHYLCVLRNKGINRRHLSIEDFKRGGSYECARHSGSEKLGGQDLILYVRGYQPSELQNVTDDEEGDNEAAAPGPAVPPAPAAPAAPAAPGNSMSYGPRKPVRDLNKYPIESKLPNGTIVKIRGRIGAMDAWDQFGDPSKWPKPNIQPLQVPKSTADTGNNPADDGGPYHSPPAAGYTSPRMSSDDEVSDDEEPGPDSDDKYSLAPQDVTYQKACEAAARLNQQEAQRQATFLEAAATLAGKRLFDGQGVPEKAKRVCWPTVSPPDSDVGEM